MNPKTKRNGRRTPAQPAPTPTPTASRPLPAPVAVGGHVVVTFRLPEGLLRDIDRAVQAQDAKHPGSRASRTSIAVAVLGGQARLTDLLK